MLSVFFVYLMCGINVCFQKKNAQKNVALRSERDQKIVYTKKSAAATDSKKTISATQRVAFSKISLNNL